MGVEARPLELVIMQQPASTPTPVRHPLHKQESESPRRFAYLVLQLPSNSASGSVAVSYAGDALQTVKLEDCFGATATVAYADCDCALICAPSACALFVVYELCLTDVRVQAASNVYVHISLFRVLEPLKKAFAHCAGRMNPQ